MKATARYFLIIHPQLPHFYSHILLSLCPLLEKEKGLEIFSPPNVHRFITPLLAYSEKSSKFVSVLHNPSSHSFAVPVPYLTLQHLIYNIVFDFSLSKTCTVHTLINSISHKKRLALDNLLLFDFSTRHSVKDTFVRPQEP